MTMATALQEIHEFLRVSLAQKQSELIRDVPRYGRSLNRYQNRHEPQAGSLHGKPDVGHAVEKTDDCRSPVDSELLASPVDSDNAGITFATPYMHLTGKRRRLARSMQY